MVRVSERHRRRGIIICQAKKWSLPPNVQTEVTHSKSTYDKFPRSVRNIISSSGSTCSILTQEHTLSTHLALLVVSFADVLKSQTLTPLKSQKTEGFETVPFSHHTTGLDCLAGCGLLTVHRVRPITSPLSWRPASAGNGQGQHCPKTPPRSCYQGRTPWQSRVGLTRGKQRRRHQRIHNPGERVCGSYACSSLSRW